MAPDLSSFSDNELWAMRNQLSSSSSSPTYLSSADDISEDETASSVGGGLLNRARDTLGSIARNLPTINPFTPPAIGQVQSMAAQNAFPKGYDEKMREVAGLSRFASSAPEERASMYRAQGFKSKVETDPTSGEQRVLVWHRDKGYWLPEGGFWDNPLSTGSMIANADMAPVAGGPMGFGAKAVGARALSGLGISGLQDYVKSQLLGEDFELDPVNAAVNTGATVLSPAIGEAIQKGASLVQSGVNKVLKKAPGLVEKAKQVPGAIKGIARKLSLTEEEIAKLNGGATSPFMDLGRSTVEIRDVLGVTSKRKIGELASDLQRYGTLAPEQATKIAKIPTLQGKADELGLQLHDWNKQLRDFYTANDLELRVGDVFNEDVLQKLNANNYTKRVTEELGGSRLLNEAEKAGVKRAEKNLVLSFLEDAVDNRVGGASGDSLLVPEYVSHMKRILEKVKLKPKASKTLPKIQTVKLGEGDEIVDTTKGSLIIPKHVANTNDKVVFDEWLGQQDIDPRSIIQAMQDEPIRLKDAVELRKLVDGLSYFDKDATNLQRKLIRDAGASVRNKLHGVIQTNLPDQYAQFVQINDSVHHLIPLVEEFGVNAAATLGEQLPPGRFVGGAIGTPWRRAWQTYNNLNRRPEVQALIATAQERGQETLAKLNTKMGNLPTLSEKMVDMKVPHWEAMKVANQLASFESLRTIARAETLAPQEEPSFELFPRQVSQITEKYLDELAGKILPSGSPQDENEAKGAMLIQSAVKAYSTGDDEELRTVMEDVTATYPELFDDGDGFDGKITSQQGQKLYLDRLKKKSIEGSTADKLLYAKQMSAFNQGDSRLIGAVPSRGKRAKNPIRNKKPTASYRRQYDY